jgi:ribonuclease HI
LPAFPGRIGQATNNKAEYRAIIAALEEAIRLGASDVDVRSDSQLVVNKSMALGE